MERTKNRKFSTMIAASVAAVTAVCTLLLFLLANSNMTNAMHESAVNNMESALAAKAGVIDQYVDKAEKILIGYGKAPVVAQLLKDPTNAQLVAQAQQYTENYYAGLEGWEGIYIGEWNTHIIAHSNPDVVGMTTREGDPLKQL